MSNQMKPSVLIVILNYGTYDLTIKLVDDIHKKIEYSNYSILVVDNCSPNESAKVLDDHQKERGYTLIVNSINAGYASGNNIGIRYGIENHYDYTWVLNNDVEIREHNILAHLVEIAESTTSIACVGPKIYSFDGSSCAPYVRRPDLWNMTFGIFAEKKYREQFINMSREVYRVYGCCMLLKNSAMEKANCFDERTFLYEEENILAERLLKHDYITFYDAEVSITHNESSSMKRMSVHRKIFQIKETNKSMNLYLKVYRRYNLLACYICCLVRDLIIFYKKEKTNHKP